MVGPLRESAHVKQSISPGVDAKINAKDPDEVQDKASFHLKEKTKSLSDQNTAGVKLFKGNYKNIDFLPKMDICIVT